MRVAITYQHSLTLGGSERVLEILADMYPSADFFCMVLRKDAIPPRLRGRRIKTTFLNSIPGAKKFYPFFLAVCPLAVEMLDLTAYDLVISSDGSHTMGVQTREDAIHVCYCHSPHRSLWDQYTAYRQSLSFPVRTFFTLSAHYVRPFNFFAAQRIDSLIANSNYIARRIQKYYRRESSVIYPPVDTKQGFISKEIDNYYLSVGRLTKLKRLDLLIEACNRLKQRLVIVGAGPDERRLKSMAGPSIQFLGRVEEQFLPALYAHARAFLFAANEDFGIVPVEAQSYGRPVVAYGHGGSLETVVDVNNSEGRVPTGVLFPEQSVNSVIAGIKELERTYHGFIPAEIQNHARQFDNDVFVKKMRSHIEGLLVRRCSGTNMVIESPVVPVS